MTALLALLDADFCWMLGEGPGRPGLALPAGGVDDPETLAHVRAINAAAAERVGPLGGCWMMVSGGEVVGLVGVARPPGDDGEIEIGYGVAASRRRRGHAARAVAAVVAIAQAEPAIVAVRAVTNVDNIASHGVLRRNGFTEIDREDRDEDGPVILWRRALR